MMVQVDREIVDISVAFAQQQKFTTELVHGLEQKINGQFAAVERRFVALERRMDVLEHRMDALEHRMDALEQKMDAGFSRLESKLDLFIEAQTTFNRLVDARLRRLEA